MEKISFLVFHITILFMFTSIPSIVLSANTTPFKLKLIHHASLHSPLPQYDTDLLNEEAPHDIRADILSKSGVLLFLVNISIGNSPISQLLSMDTGSSLLWIKCNSTFAASSTYINNYCNSSWCYEAGGTCDSQRNCTYVQNYVDKSTSNGMLANETFIFETSDDGLVTIPDIVFGCGNKNRLSINSDGVIGLGARSLSIIRQLKITRFSYCLGNIRDTYYNFNQLILGGGDVDQIDQDNSSPLEIYNGLYYLKLEGISVGDKRLDISPEEFTRDIGGNGGVIIDSGATYSHFTRRPFNLLRAEVDGHMNKGAYWLPHPTNDDMLCYNGVFIRDIEDFPVVKFHLAGGLDIELDIDSLFEQVDTGYYCMAIGSSEANGLRNLNLIGMKAQQFYNTVYDLDQMKISMQRMDCSYLQD